MFELHRLAWAARRGFTLVELLVVISIVGLLIALLLPAVQAAREAARRSECSNNLRQFGLGAMTHESSQGFLPSGGWGWRWAGDPDRGYGKSQPGGWYFNLLEYIELSSLRRLGSDGDRDAITTRQREDGAVRARQPVSIFMCPSRRGALQYPYRHSYSFYNIALNGAGDMVGRNDYAANAGSQFPATFVDSGPATIQQAPTYEYSAYNQAEERRYGFLTIIPGADGAVAARSEIRLANVEDGTSNTIFLGEKFIPQGNYDLGSTPEDNNHGNDQGWDIGYDHDVVRWTASEPRPDSYPFANRNDPAQYRIFGSAHSVGIQFAYCDGSVHVLDYDVDATVFRALGTRAGRETPTAQ